MIAASLASTRGLLLVTAGLSAPRAPSATCSQDAPWPSFRRFNEGAWKGYAVIVDPATAVPRLPGIQYEHFVSADDPEKLAMRTYTTRDGDAEKVTEDFNLDGTGLDIDLDGSYSTEHADGLGLASLLLERDDESSASCLVVEHSLAVSDEERRRSLLVYGDGELEAVILLAECKGGAPEPAAHSTLFSLVGAWSGDSCVRSAGAATQAFTQSSGGKNPFGFGGANKGGKEAKGGASPAILATRRTNVFKAALTYAWDGAATVMRQLQVTSFGNEALDAIRTSGTLQTVGGDFGEYESVAFSGDPLEPTLLLLPAGCHLIAPRKLPAASAPTTYSTEFGAMLEAGESFGWRGFTGGEEGAASQEQDEDSARLVRIQRLYSGGAFVSGTTSLLTAQ